MTCCRAGLCTPKPEFKRDLDSMTAITRLDKYQAINVDDMGYVKKTDVETQVLLEFIANRYESGSLIIIPNQPFSQWDHIFPDTMMTVALLIALFIIQSLLK